MVSSTCYLETRRASRIDQDGRMGYHFGMKTTIDISDHLLRRVKALAREEETTLKDLTEEGLELVLERHSSRGPHVVKPVVF